MNRTSRIIRTAAILLPLVALVIYAQILPSSGTGSGTGAAKDSANIFPKMVGPVNDFEGLLDTATKGKLAAMIAAHEKKTTQQIVVVTVASVAPYESVDGYTAALGNYWHVGRGDKGEGVVIMLSKTLHQAQLSVSRGLEGRLSDSTGFSIIREKMVPSFRKNDYGQGLVDGVGEIIRLLEMP
jgi:uncharacterized protein